MITWSKRDCEKIFYRITSSGKLYSNYGYILLIIIIIQMILSYTLYPQINFLDIKLNKFPTQ